MQHTITFLIYLHAFFGGLGLIAGIISIAVKKGGSRHIRSGKVFSYSMILSSLISLVVARLPKHENLFLFLIGVFTIYMVLAGNRALTFKSRSKTRANLIDRLISGSMLLASIAMLLIGTIGMFRQIANSILYVFFGSFGLFMTLRDFKTFSVFRNRKNAWLKSHLSRMIGALIASLTAFLVAGLNIGTTIVWILPTIIGTGYIVFWNRRLRKLPLKGSFQAAEP